MSGYRLHRIVACAWVLLLLTMNTAAIACTAAPGMRVQVLASGDRHTSGYVIWYNDKSQFLLDVGPGSAELLQKSGARFEDLDAILLSHLQVNHSSDLPALIHASFHSRRQRPLPLFGPTGNKTTPGTVAFVRALFDPIRGAYRYLGDVLSPRDRGPYKLRPLDIDAVRTPVVAFARDQRTATALLLDRRAPALVWSIAANGKRIVFLGDADPNDRALGAFVAGADIVIAHARPSKSTAGVDAAALGRLAAHAKADRILLAAIGTYADTATEYSARVKAQFQGPVDVMRELACYAP